MFVPLVFEPFRMCFLSCKTRRDAVKHHHLLSFFTNVFCNHFRKKPRKEGLVKKSGASADDVPCVINRSEHFADGFGEQGGLFFGALLEVVSEPPSTSLPTAQFCIFWKQTGLPHPVGDGFDDGVVQ